MSNVQKLKVNSQTNIYEASGAIATAGSVFDVSSATGATNLIALAADGNTGVTIGSTMTVSPELTAEDGFLTITVAGVAYQIPIYAA
jgi:hypothetical protein